MKNITYRSNFLKTETVDGITQYDLGSMNFKDFDWGENLYYVTKEEDLGRPDIISQKIYGTVNYAWFLMKYNGICDIHYDIKLAQYIKYPSIDRVREAFKLYSYE